MPLIHAALAISVILGLVAAPAAAEAQAAARAHRIGLLESSPPNPAADAFGQWGAFREGLRALGYVDGRTVAIESRWADDKYERLPNLAAELVRLGSEVLDFSRLVAGNMVSLQLADFGAEVVKVEAPGRGDTLRDWREAGLSVHWKVYARNKKSITLDLKAPEAPGIVLDLVVKRGVI